MVRTAVLVVALGVTGGAFFGCGADDDDSGTPAGSNGGAANGGSAGTTAGSGGVAPAGSGGSTMMPGGFVPGSATYAAIYQEVFVGTGCSGGPYCHGSGNLTGGLDMTDKAKTYTELINVAAMAMNLPPGGTDCKTVAMMRVVPGNPDASLLMNKITQATPVCGKGMPPTGMIDAAKIAQVRTWIMNGAHDD